MGLHKRWIYIFSPIMGLLGCETSRHPEADKVCYLRSQAPWQKVIRKAVTKMQDGDLDGASFDVNLALQNFPKQPALHLINALIYEEKASKGGVENNDLALVGYQNASKLDNGNWYAFYRAGLLKFKSADYTRAQDLFAKASLLHPHNPEVFYSLAMASYYARDIEAARLSIQEALKYHKGKNPLFLRAAALIFAATGQKEKSQLYFQKLKGVIGNEEPDLLNVQERVESWLALHQKGIYTQVEGTQEEIQNEQYANETLTNPAVVFDCYILAIDEKATNTKGINFFDTLKLTLQPQSLSYSFPVGQPGAAATLTKQITWPAVTYNLNIMNLIDNRVEILARPTLSTFLKTQAVFSSGTTLSAGISGSSGGSVVNIPTGVILSIMPTKIEGELVTLDVQLESSLPKLDSANFDPATAFSSQVIQILKTKMETTLQVNFDETRMIGGMYGRISQYNKDGFPILQDIPIVQLLSSQETSQYQKTSVLFLVTPRRPEELADRTKKRITLDKQRQNLPALKDWLSNHKEVGDQDPALALIVRNVSPKNAEEYYRRGDVLPIDDSPLVSLRDEVSPISSFLYY